MVIPKDTVAICHPFSMCTLIIVSSTGDITARRPQLIVISGQGCYFNDKLIELQTSARLGKKKTFYEYYVFEEKIIYSTFRIFCSVQYTIIYLVLIKLERDNFLCSQTKVVFH